MEEESCPQDRSYFATWLQDRMDLEFACENVLCVRETQLNWNAQMHWQRLKLCLRLIQLTNLKVR